MATKRMSHANCDHPKTPNERAKCRSQHNTRNQARENVRVVTNQAHPSVSELADMLADSLSGLKSAKDLVLQREGEVAELQASLAEQMLEREPRSVNGQMPVVAFEKRFRSDSNKAYHYAALGLETEMVRREYADQGGYYSSESPKGVEFGYGEATYIETVWYLTSAPGRAGSPKTWAELVEFMGVDGLKTLQVLRGQ